MAGFGGGGGGGMGGMGGKMGNFMKFMQMFGNSKGGGKGGGMGSMLGGMMGGGGGGSNVGPDGYDHSADWSSPGGGYATSPMVEQFFGVSNADPGGPPKVSKSAPVVQPTFGNDSGGSKDSLSGLMKLIDGAVQKGKINNRTNAAVGNLNSMQNFPDTPQIPASAQPNQIELDDAIRRQNFMPSDLQNKNLFNQNYNQMMS